MNKKGSIKQPNNHNKRRTAAGKQVSLYAKKKIMLINLFYATINHLSHMYLDRLMAPQSTILLINTKYELLLKKAIHRNNYKFYRNVKNYFIKNNETQLLHYSRRFIK